MKFATYRLELRVGRRHMPELISSTDQSLDILEQNFVDEAALTDIHEYNGKIISPSTRWRFSCPERDPTLLYTIVFS